MAPRLQLGGCQILCHAICLKCVCFGGLLLGPDVFHKLDRGSIGLDHLVPLTSTPVVDVLGWEPVAPVRSSVQLRGYRFSRSGNIYEGRPLVRPTLSSGVGEVLPQISTQQLTPADAGASAPSAPHAASHFFRGRGVSRCRPYLYCLREPAWFGLGTRFGASRDSPDRALSSPCASSSFSLSFPLL